jgi:MFS superfamily sulfate permease-like transporter
MESDLADAQEVKAAEESAWEILTGFSLPKYAVDSLTHYKNNPESFKNEVLSGITVAVMQVPESVAFSFVAGVPPLVGLYSTFFLGFITAVIGGKEGMISGAAGAMAVVIKDLMADSGPLSSYSKGDRFNHLLMTVLVCGILQTLCGLFQLAKLVKLISKPCMVGFMNGLGIVIFYAQFGAFKKCPYAKATAPESPDYFSDCKENERRWMELGGEDAAKTWLTLLLVAFTMAIMVGWPKVIPQKYQRLLPSSLVAIIFGTLWEHYVNREGFGISTRTVGGTEQLKGAFPRYHLPQVPSNGNGEWGIIFQYGISLTFVGLIESVMTLQACDEITETLPSVFRSNQECVAQGIANAVSGLFGAMGGDAMIGQSTINISVNGARGRLSGATAGILMLFFVVALSPVISTVPIGTLTGVLFMVVLSTFNWQTFPMLASHVLPEPLLKCVERVAGPLPRIPKADAFVIVLTTVLAVYFNLAVGVVVGTVVLSTFDAWNRGARFQVVKGTSGPGCVVYQPLQPLFFGTSKDFARAFTPGADPQKCVVDLSRSAVADYTAVDALADVAARYEKVEKSFEIIGVSADDKKFIQRAGPAVKGAADALDGGVTRVSSKTALVEDIEANPKDVELRQRAGSHS